MLCTMETDGAEGVTIEPASAGAEVIRLRPLRLLVLSRDHRFRSVIEMLMARRECSAFGLGSADDVAETIAHERVDVALVDGLPLLEEVARDVAQSAAAAPPVGVVLVGEAAESGLAGLRTLPKWGGFDELFAAIADADRARSRPPAADRAAGLSLAAAHQLG
jgi:hypothetical protein